MKKAQYEAEYGPFTPDEMAQADEWAAGLVSHMA
jgi:hypothetical protein